MSNQARSSSDRSYFIKSNHLAIVDNIPKWGGTQTLENSLAAINDFGVLSVPSIETGDLIADPLSVDNIFEKTPDAGVKIENKFHITQNGTDMEMRLGNVANPNATQDVHYNMVAKRDIDFHLVSDTDAVATNDDPNIYLWRDGQTRLSKFCICNTSGYVKHVIAGDGTNPGFSIETGGTYTAPAVTGDDITVPTISNLKEAFTLTSTQNASFPNGDLTVGAPTKATTSLARVSSEAAAYFWIQADTNNVAPETNVPYLILSTDGQLTGAQISMGPTSDHLEVRGEKSVEFYTESTITNNGDNAVPTFTTGTLSLTVGNGGILLPSTGGTGSVITYAGTRESATGTWTGNTGAWNSTSVTAYFTRVGSLVTMEFASDYSAPLTNAGNYIISNAGFIPTRFRPSTTQLQRTIEKNNNSVFGFGSVLVYSTGNIEIYNGVSGTGFTGGGATAGFNNFTMSWTV